MCVTILVYLPNRSVMYVHLRLAALRPVRSTVTVNEAKSFGTIKDGADPARECPRQAQM